MELISTHCLGKPLSLRASMAGWQQLTWDRHIVGQRPASADNEGPFSYEFRVLPETDPAEHTNREIDQTIASQVEAITIRLEFHVQWQDFRVEYQLFQNDVEIERGQRTASDLQRATPVEVSGQQATATKTSGKSFALIALALKLLQSAKFVKFALAGLTLATYSAIFSFHFALALIACLVVHEYGHVRAMKYFGLKTKGFYLIPFFGGMAVTDEKLNTRWQDIVISIMGPTFGMLLSLALWVAYLFTDNTYLAALANFNAFLNLIQMIPVLPLDGGHVIKSIAFSASTKVATIILSLASVLGIFVSYSLGYFFLAFILFIGTLDIVVEWRHRKHSLLLPLNRYGQIVSTVWYLATFAVLFGIMWHFAQSGDPLMSSPMAILRN